MEHIQRPPLESSAPPLQPVTTPSSDLSLIGTAQGNASQPPTNASPRPSTTKKEGLPLAERIKNFFKNTDWKKVGKYALITTIVAAALFTGFGVPFIVLGVAALKIMPFILLGTLGTTAVGAGTYALKQLDKQFPEKG